MESKKIQLTSEQQEISNKSSKSFNECSCSKCKNMCQKVSCLGTPSDILKILKSNPNFKNKIAPTIWMAGISFGISPLKIIAPIYDRQLNKCSFYDSKNGLCTIHDIKPTEGKLSNHETQHIKSIDEWLTLNVVKTWADPKNIDIVKEIESIIYM